MSKKRTRKENDDFDFDGESACVRLTCIIEGDEKQPSYDDLKKLVMRIKKAGMIDARRDEYGYALLHNAVRRSNTEITELLLRSGANPDVAVEGVSDDDLSDAESDVGCVPLHFAASEIMAKLLLGDDEDSGGVERFWEADVDARDAWGNTPFDRCVRFDDPDMARFFLERSKNILAGDGHAKKRVTTGCALAMKIAELEERQHSTHEDDKVIRAPFLFRDLLPTFANRSNPAALVADMESYGKNFYPVDQKAGVYAILVDLLGTTRDAREAM